MEKLKTALRDILPDIPHDYYDQGRKGRGLGSWLGGLIGGALGLVTEFDIRTLENHLQETVKNQNQQIEATKRISKEMSSFVQITSEKLNMLNKELVENSQNTLRLMEAISRDYNRQIHFLNNLSLTTMNLMHIVNSLTAYLTELLAACEILLTGKLSSFLIPSSAIMETIDHIEEELLKQGNGQHLIFNDPYFYFSSATFIYLRQGQNLIVTVQFPISQFPEEFDVYLIQDFPMTLPGQPKNVLRLPGLPAAIAVQRGMSLYFNLTENQVKSVIAEHYATPQTILNDNAYETCLMSIFKDEQSKIMQLCNFEIHMEQLRPSIFPLEGSKFYMLNITKYHLQCPNGKMEIQGCSTCVIKIAKGCTFQYHHIFIAASYMENSTSEMKHILNAPLLASFYANETLFFINGDTKLDEPQTLDIPEFTFYNHSILNAMASQEKFNVDLKKAVESVKKADVIIRHMPDAIALSHIAIGDKNIFWNTVAGYTVISMGILIFLLILNVCYLLYRIRMLTILVLLLKQNMVKVEAMTTPKIPRDLFVLTTTALPPTVSTMDLHSQLVSWSDKYGVYIILLTLTACIVIYIIRGIYRKTCRHISLDNKTALKLEIQAGSKAANIMIQMFNGKPESFLVLPPTQKPTMEITGFCSPILTVNWKNARIISEEEASQFPFAPNIQTSFFMGLFLRYLLRNTHSTEIYLEFNQQRYNIPIKTTHQTTAFGRSRHSRRQQPLLREIGPTPSAPPAPLHM
jgi:hypothetical protein